MQLFGLKVNSRLTCSFLCVLLDSLLSWPCVPGIYLAPGFCASVMPRLVLHTRQYSLLVLAVPCLPSLQSSHAAHALPVRIHAHPSLVLHALHLDADHRESMPSVLHLGVPQICGLKSGASEGHHLAPPYSQKPCSSESRRVRNHQLPGLVLQRLVALRVAAARLAHTREDGPTVLTRDT
jgi:hypothetical protein